MPQTPSTRWCPTPEQLMILEEMYRTGVRTPNASQIQQITAHLSFYGKIEGKNVFYWFQNHKARDRQKLRRRLSRQHHLLHSLQQQQQDNNPTTSQLLHQTPPPLPLHFLHQGGGPQEEAQGMNLLSKLESGDIMAAPLAAPPAMYSQDWMMMMTMESTSTDSQPCCMRPLKTLDLFPTKTKSTNLKDECSTSKSSCSTSTN